jgi:transposase-like protein
LGPRPFTLREGGPVVSKAVQIADAVSEENYRKELGLELAHGEMTEQCLQVLPSPVERGLRGTQLVTSDRPLGQLAIVHGYCAFFCVAQEFGGSWRVGRGTLDDY